MGVSDTNALTGSLSRTRQACAPLVGGLLTFIHTTGICENAVAFAASTMVYIACALIDDSNFRFATPRAVMYVTDVELSMTVAAFTDVIHPVLDDRHGFSIHHLRLFVAKSGDKSWPRYSDVRWLRPSDVERTNPFMEPTKLLSEFFGPTSQPPDDNGVHVLVLSPSGGFPMTAPFDMMLEEKRAKVLASAHRTGVLPSSLGDAADVDLWTMNDCGQMKDLSSWRSILPLLPQACFVRLEALMVWRVFRENFQQRLDADNDVETKSGSRGATRGHQSDQLPQHRCISLWGSPGVGKRVLLALMCVWLAVKQKRDVVLLRYVGWELRATLLAGQTGLYYEWECCDFGLWDQEDSERRVQNFVSLLKRVNKPERVWVCVDNVSHDEFYSTFRGIELDMWSAYGDVNASAVHCLVPFWTQSDLKTVGRLRGFDDEECTQRCAVSGGSLGQFLKRIDDAKRFLDGVLHEPAWDSIAKLRKIEPGCRQVVYMHTVVDRMVLKHYVEGTFQREVLTSHYAKERIGLCEMLWGFLCEDYEEDGLAL